MWEGLAEARMPHFALDSVVVTVDGWDHLIHTGSKDAYCRFFLYPRRRGKLSAIAPTNSSISYISAMWAGML